MMDGHYNGPNTQQQGPQHQAPLAHLQQQYPHLMTTGHHRGQLITHAESVETNCYTEGTDVTEGWDDSASEETNVVVAALKKPAVKKLLPTVTLPLLNNPTSARIHEFIRLLIEDRPFQPCFHILRYVTMGWREDWV